MKLQSPVILNILLLVFTFCIVVPQNLTAEEFARGENVRIDLRDGASLSGPLLKETEKSVVLDLGYDVI
ncbi:MAG: hypothetical protein HRU15_12060 [Planctomycetes bacterium]|nr:hypothetical protein [Planctomycetota bacterium]